MKYTAVTISRETTGIAEFLGFYRLACDICARGGLGDWGEMKFTLECEFASAGVLPDKEREVLQAELSELGMGGQFVVKEF